IGAATIFLQQGFKIPNDLSLVGFGNVLLSEHFRVPLTTIRQPKFRLGAAAMESMVKILKGEHPASKRLPAEIVLRASSGPPPHPCPVSCWRFPPSPPGGEERGGERGPVKPARNPLSPTLSP